MSVSCLGSVGVVTVNTVSFQAICTILKKYYISSIYCLVITYLFYIIMIQDLTSLLQGSYPFGPPWTLGPALFVR